MGSQEKLTIDVSCELPAKSICEASLSERADFVGERCWGLLLLFRLITKKIGKKHF